MNKSAFFYVLLVLIAYSSSSKLASFSGVLTQLVSLNKAAGRDSSDISILVSQVASATKEAEEKFDSFMSGLVYRCSEGKRLQDSFTKNLNDDIVNIKAQSSRAEAENKIKDKDNEEHKSQLKTAEASLKKLKDEIAKAYEALATYGAEAEQKMVIVKTLRDIITDELLVPQGSSFVQLSTFSKKLKELKGLLEKSRDSQFAPLVSTLLSLAQSNNFADQGMLNQILKVLQTLEANLLAFRRKQEGNDKENINDLKKLAVEKVKQIKDLAEMIANNESSIGDNLNLMTAAEKDLASLQREIDRKGGEVDYFSKICAYENELKVKEENYRQSFAEHIKELANKLVDLK